MCTITRKMSNDYLFRVEQGILEFLDITCGFPEYISSFEKRNACLVNTLHCVLNRKGQSSCTTEWVVWHKVSLSR